ncbi:major facilitator superfamily domain-containing protein [Russula compacta]|nr:major facilitator superfamily domain-containing protein [Russula compacta]
MPSASLSPPSSQPRLRAGAVQSTYPSNSTQGQPEVNDETASEDSELLHELMHSHTRTPVEELLRPDPTTYKIGGLQVDKIALEAQRLERAARPWWRRPSATWLLVLSPLSTLAASALIAPRLQLYTYLMCKDLNTGPWNPENRPTTPDTSSAGSTPLEICAADPVVQANVAKLLTITATVQGILSCLTVTFWGSFSDRYGRVRYLGFNTTSLLLSDIAVTALAVVPEYVPGNYWILVFASAFEGLLGGRSAFATAAYAYFSDCSDPSTRSRIFSRFIGLICVGLAFGPTLGAVIERFSGKPSIVFYVALGLHVMCALYTWFIIPESLLPAQMDAARRARSGSGSGSRGHWFIRIFSFLAPLVALAPQPRKWGASVSPQKAPNQDWSLTWLALSLAPESLVAGSLQYCLQYAIGKFSWSAMTTGYYISMIGITRGLFLVIGLPAILHFCAPKTPPIQLPTSLNEPLDASSSVPKPAFSSSLAHAHTPAVDLSLARVSLVLQAMFFALIAISGDARVFVATGALGALATGYLPTVQSLALELYTRRGGAGSEAGRLFGAISVIQTIGNQVLGPSLFGIVYIKTVATLPETIFYVVVVVVLLSLFFLFLVRIPPDPEAPAADAEEVEAPAVVDGIATVMDDE